MLRFLRETFHTIGQDSAVKIIEACPYLVVHHPSSIILVYGCFILYCELFGNLKIIYFGISDDENYFSILESISG